VRVNGETVRNVLDGIDELPDERERAVRAIFDANGFRDVDDDAWYAQQAWLASLQAVAEAVGPRALQSLGRHVPKTTVWPSAVTTVPDAIASIDAAYRMNHRGPDLGEYGFIRTDDHQGRVTSTTPYPCRFDVGLVEGVVREFSPTVTATAMAFVHKVGDACRDDGGDRCTYAIRW
jgi:hypothetical protein